MLRKLLFLLVLSSPLLPLSGYSQSINNFSQAKAIAAKINQDAPGSFYCGCKIDWQGKKGFRI